MLRAESRPADRDDRAAKVRFLSSDGYPLLWGLGGNGVRKGAAATSEYAIWIRCTKRLVDCSWAKLIHRLHEVAIKRIWDGGLLAGIATRVENIT